MSVSVWVALFRNFFCVCKSLIPASSFLQQPLNINEIISKPSALEAIVGILQLYAVFANIISGITKLRSGLSDTYHFLLVGRKTMNAVKEETEFKDEDKLFKSIYSEDIGEFISSIRIKVISGICEITIGISFFFLFSNSYHYYFQGHPKPVIDALIFMEIALLYFLYLMLKSFVKVYRDINRCITLANLLENNKSSQESVRGLIEAFIKSGYFRDISHALKIMKPTYSLKWRESSIVKKDDKKQNIEQIVKKDLDSIRQTLEKYCSIKKGKDIDKKAVSNRQLACRNLRSYAKKSNVQAPLEFIYFILNIIAGYGYLLGILAFYVSEDNQHVIFKILKLGLNNPNADWYGNLVGDAAWTIEPLLILLSGRIIDFFLQTKGKGTATAVNDKKKKKRN